MKLIPKFHCENELFPLRFTTWDAKDFWSTVFFTKHLKSHYRHRLVAEIQATLGLNAFSSWLAYLNKTLRIKFYFSKKCTSCHCSFVRCRRLVNCRIEFDFFDLRCACISWSIKYYDCIEECFFTLDDSKKWLKLKSASNIASLDVTWHFLGLVEWLLCFDFFFRLNFVYRLLFYSIH